jgi:hypothetical protein
MTIPVGTVKVVFGGSLPTPEKFAFSFWLGSTPITTQAAANTLATDIVTAFASTAKANVLAYLMNSGSYDNVKVYCYPVGGPTASVIGQATIASGAGTGTSNPHPLQCAIVVSLRTSFAGRRNRGRLYLPLTSVALTAHQLTSSQCADIAGAMAAFFNSLNANSSYGDVSIVSQVGTGLVTKVSSVIVDSRVDVQRRRANRSVAIASNTQTVT